MISVSRDLFSDRHSRPNPLEKLAGVSWRMAEAELDPVLKQYRYQEALQLKILAREDPHRNTEPPEVTLAGYFYESDSVDDTLRQLRIARKIAVEDEEFREHWETDLRSATKYAPYWTTIRIIERQLEDISREARNRHHDSALPIVLTVILAPLTLGTLLFGHWATGVLFGVLLVLAVVGVFVATARKRMAERRLLGLEQFLIDAGFRVKWSSGASSVGISWPD